MAKIQDLVAAVSVYVLTAAAAVVLALAVGCSTAKRKTTPELSKLEGKKVALIDIEGEASSRSVVEVALINQLVQRGTFILVSKQEVEQARQNPKQDPTDWKGIARRAGAEFALRARVMQFDGDIAEGYSSEDVEDSQLAEERGEKDAKTTRYFKVKSLTGKVKVQLEFADLADSSADLRTGVAEAEDKVVAEARSEAAHLPPKLRFLEQLANKAFHDFFERYR